VKNILVPSIGIKYRWHRRRESVSCVWLYSDRYLDWFACDPGERLRASYTSILNNVSLRSKDMTS
jgi:hypothetical protein